MKFIINNCLLITSFTLFCCFSCQQGPPTNTEKDQVVESFDKTKIENLLASFDQDEDLKYQGATQILGDATVIYELLTNAKNMQLIQQDVRTTFTASDISYIFNVSTNALIYSEIKKYTRLCNSNNDICLNWQKNYYSNGELAEALLFQDTISNLKDPSFEQATLKPRPLGNPLLAKADKALFDGLIKKIGELEAQQGRIYEGKYRYFADAAGFKECETQKYFDVESLELEQSYMQLGTEKEAFTKVLAFEAALPNMENKPVPALVVWKLIEMSVTAECSTK